ncbi:MAG: alpha/beta hydrolase [Bryobacteraceae bacterium]
MTGDWMGRLDKPIAMSKGDDGVWLARAGPLEPNAYFYSFTVDGVRAADPANANTIVAGGGRFPQSMLQVRGDRASVWEPQPVPKGSVHVEFFESALQRRERSYYVYTPPNYSNSGRQRFPVLVLLPGTPGTEADWITVGLANHVFDNLIARRSMQPMVVLMPRADVLVKGGTRSDNLKEFEPLLIREMLPHFESRYRVTLKPNARAIAGYSLGGELALTVGLRHPELFRAVGSFGGSVFEREFEDRFGKAWADPRAMARDYSLIWIGCGSGDLLLPGNRKLSDTLKQKNIPHTFHEIAGYHSMPTFRGLLIDFVQVLFREIAMR